MATINASTGRIQVTLDLSVEEARQLAGLTRLPLWEGDAEWLEGFYDALYDSGVTKYYRWTHPDTGDVIGDGREDLEISELREAL